MSTFGEFTKDGHGEPMAMLSTLPLEKKTELSGNRAKRFLGQPAILNRFWQRCRKRSGAIPCFSMK